MPNRLYSLTLKRNFIIVLTSVHKRYTSSQKISQELVPVIKKEVLQNSPSIKNTNVGQNLVAKQDFSARVLHPMTPVFNPGLPAHVAAVNAPNSSANVFDHVQQSNTIGNSYLSYGPIYRDNFYNVSNARLFNVFHERNITSCFHTSRIENNVIVTPFITNMKNLPGYVQNPNQAKPDVLVDCRNSKVPYKGIQSYDHKAIYTKNMHPGKVYTHTIFYGVDESNYKNTLTDFAEKYRDKHGSLSNEQKDVLLQLEANSLDIEAQTSIITRNLHLFHPLSLPPIRTEEFFYTKHCTDKFVSDVKFAQGKNNFVSSLLYKNTVPVGIDSKSSGSILHDHKDLLNIINDYAT